MVAVGVELDDQVLAWPKEVDETTLNQHVDLWRWHTSAAAKREEINLDSRASVDGSWICLDGYPPKARHSDALNTLFDQAPELAPAQTPTAFRRGQSTAQLEIVKECGQVEKGALERRDSDPVFDRDLLRRETIDLPNCNSMPASAP